MSLTYSEQMIAKRSVLAYLPNDHVPVLLSCKVLLFAIDKEKLLHAIDLSGKISKIIISTYLLSD